MAVIPGTYKSLLKGIQNRQPVVPEEGFFEPKPNEATDFSLLGRRTKIKAAFYRNSSIDPVKTLEERPAEIFANLMFAYFCIFLSQSKASQHLKNAEKKPKEHATRLLKFSIF